MTQGLFFDSFFCARFFGALLIYRRKGRKKERSDAYVERKQDPKP